MCRPHAKVQHPSQAGKKHSAPACRPGESLSRLPGQLLLLTRQKFQTVRARFVAAYWITKAPPPTIVGLRVRHFQSEFEPPDAQSWFLLQAMDALQRERHEFLYKLHRFERRRIREKLRGKRHLSRSELEALYAQDYLTVK